MLFEYIERARSQPKEVRVRIALVWSTVCTGIIILVWLSVLFGRQYAEGGATKTQTPLGTETETPDTTTRFNAANDFLNTTAVSLPSDSMKNSESDTATATGTPASSGTVPTSTSTSARATTSIQEQTPTPQLWP